MANPKYCEPALHNSCDFEGTISGSVLTISRIYAGAPAIGQILTAIDSSGYLANTGNPNYTQYINSFGTVNADGTGTYNLLSNPGNTNGTTRFIARGGNLAGKPLVGLAQDGDGTAKGRGAPATALIDFTGYSVATQASQSSTILFSLFGISIYASNAQTTTTSLTTFNTASSATSTAAGLVTALANAINACQQNIVPSGGIASWRATQLRAFVYAYAEGTTLRIQARVASSLLNAFSAVSTGFTVTGGVQVNKAFSGGVSGAWGYLISVGSTPLADGVTNNAGYGLWASVIIGGSMDPGDEIRIRASDSLDSSRDAVVIAGYTSSGTTSSIKSFGTAMQPVTFVVDDGTEWPSPANVTPTLRMAITGNANGASLYIFSSSSSMPFMRLIGKRYANGNANISWETGPYAPYLLFYMPMQANVANMDFNFASASSYGGVIQFGPPTITTVGAYSGLWEGINVRSGQSAAFFSVTTNSNANQNIKLRDWEIDNSGNSTRHSGIFGPASHGPQGMWTMESVRFKNFVGSLAGGFSSMFAPGTDFRSTAWMKFIDCDYPNIQFGPNLCTVARGDVSTRQYSGFSKYGNREFFMDTTSGYYDWTTTAGYPTLNAKLKNGSTDVPYVIRATTSTVTGTTNQCNEFCPLELPRISKINTLGAGNRKLTLNFAVNDALAANASMISFLVSYKSSDGGYVNINTFDRNGGALTPAPEAVWSSMAAGKVRYSGTDHSPYKLEITTTRPIEDGAEIVITPRLHYASANAAQCVFVDPEILMA